MRAERLVLRNNRGVSLIEILFAVLLISIVGAALLTASTVSMSMNKRNEIRSEAVKIAEERMNQLRSLLFTDSTIDAALTATGGAIPDPAGATVTRNIGNSTVTFNRMLTITDIGGGIIAGSKQITVAVSWPYKGQTFNQSITTLLKRTPS